MSALSKEAIGDLANLAELGQASGSVKVYRGACETILCLIAAHANQHERIAEYDESLMRLTVRCGAMEREITSLHSERNRLLAEISELRADVDHWRSQS